MQAHLPLALAVSLSIALAPAERAHAQDMHVVACNLGCSSGAGGAQVFCSVIAIHVNETLEVRFSQAVDPLSLTTPAFFIVDVQNGTIVAGAIYVSPADDHVVVFVPPLTFGPGGVMYGFLPNRPYEVRIGGAAQGDSPPLITSTGGLENQSRVQCAVFTSAGILPPILPYCTTSPNSVGAGGLMAATGTTSVTLNNLVLEATGLPASTVGLFVLGSQAASSPVGNGVLCVGGSLARQPVVAADATGRAVHAFDVTAPGAGLVILPGAMWRFQHVYRDVFGGGAGFNATNGLRVTFFP